MRRMIELALAVALAFAPLGARAADASEAERLATLLALKPGMRVAEIGAGEGDLAFEMAERVGLGGRVFATELAGDDLYALRRRVKFGVVTNLTVVTAQLSATGLAAGCCDAIYLRNVYHHLTDPSAIARDIQRALVPGGTLVVIDFPPTWYLVPFSPDGVGEERTGHGITPEAALRELESAGFERVQVIESWSDRWFVGDVYALVLRAPATGAAPDRARE